MFSMVKKFSNKTSSHDNYMIIYIANEIIPFVGKPFTYISNLSFNSCFPQSNENCRKIHQCTKMVQRLNLAKIDPYHYYLSMPKYLRGYFI